MSDFYLCDTCAKKLDGDHLNTCICIASFPHEHRKHVMHDHNGKGGKRYDEPTDVCQSYRPKERT